MGKVVNPRAFFRLGALALIGLIPAIVFCRESAGVLLTFSDQDPNSSDTDDPMDPSLYGPGPANGMPSGLQATFSGFNWVGPGDFLDQDHTRDANWRAIYGNGDSDDASITFNSPTIVNSLWINNSDGNFPPTPPPDGDGSSYLLLVQGLLDGVVVWHQQYTDLTNGFEEYVPTPGVAVNEVDFTDVSLVAIDDIDLAPASAIPEPAVPLAAFSAGLFFLCRRSRATPVVN